MKYWGKKPHNIWNAYIQQYCPPNGFVLDPFVGSGISAFEAVRSGRKAIAFDLNPISAFTIEALTSPFDEDAFLAAFHRITTLLESDPIYILHYTRTHKDTFATVFNYRWFEGVLQTIAIQFPAPKGKNKGKPQRVLISPDTEDHERARTLDRIPIPYWYPTNPFPNTPSVTHKFVRDIGGDSFEHLWTRRNLYLLSRLFHEILAEPDPPIRLQPLFGFAQTLHLTSKMVYPRSTVSNRDFSGSWGRADYMIRRKSMEQNPLIIFQRSCIDKQGVLAALRDVRSSFPQGISISDVTEAKKIRRSCDINYGTVDVADLHRYFRPRSIDFILTDPPYAGLVNYLPLSLIWLVWLMKVSPKYTPDLQAEITISEATPRSEYRRRLQNSFQQIHNVLKDDGRLVVTFHHKDMREWNDFVNAVRLSGFTFDKVIHQYNKRSGESNVSMPYGTSGSDFYIRCVKRRDVDFTSDSSGLDNFVIQKTIEIVARRNEPTPFNFIFDGLVPELLQAGYSQVSDSTRRVETVLVSHSGPANIFTISPNRQSKAGDFYWFTDPTKHISHPDRPLTDRVEDSIIALLRRRLSVRFDDVLGELFREYPNGLTPDIKAIKTTLEKYAYRSTGLWKIKPATLAATSEHTNMIATLARMGTRATFRVHIGKREQGERCSNGTLLGSAATLSSLSLLRNTYDAVQIERIEMIDLVWLHPNTDEIATLIEVENTTDFMSAIQRGSNVPANIPKIMAIPQSRRDELLAIPDPLFKHAFAEHNWHYTTYPTIQRLASYSRFSLEELIRVSQALEPNGH